MARTITEIIKKYIKDHGIVQSHLALLLNEHPQNLNRKLKRRSLDTDYVSRISSLLKYDFFHELSVDLKKELGSKPESVADALTDLGAKLTPEQYITMILENNKLWKENAQLLRRINEMQENKKI